MSITNVAIYVRVSTDRQAKKGDSIDEQLSTCKNYIASKENMVLAGVYIDDGISGRKIKRGDFEQLLDDVRLGRVDLIIFTKLDRWFRSLRHYLNTQAILEVNHCDWLAVDQPYFDTTTPHGRAFVAQSMTFAELEAENDSVRIRDVFDYKYRQGEVLSGKVPLGYSIENKHLVPNQDADKALRIFQFYAECGSLNQTITHLESDMGIIMSQDNLKKSILKNKKYIGVFRDNDHYCPAIIPADLFDRVQELLAINVKSSQKYSYVFSGLLRCAHCGQAFSGFTQKAKKKAGGFYKYPYYKCHGAYPNKRCINRKMVPESYIEKYLLINVKNLLQEHIAEYEIASAKIVDYDSRRATLLKKIDKLKDLYINDIITMDELKMDKEKYMKELEDLPRNQDQKDLAPIKKLLKMDLDSIYKTLEPAERRQLWRSVIKEIQIDDHKNLKIIFL